MGRSPFNDTISCWMLVSSIPLLGGYWFHRAKLATHCMSPPGQKHPSFVPIEWRRQIARANRAGAA